MLFLNPTNAVNENERDLEGCTQGKEGRKRLSDRKEVSGCVPLCVMERETAREVLVCGEGKQTQELLNYYKAHA